MNNIKSGEVMKLKDLISYEEGSIANLDVVVPLTEIYQLYGDISGSHTTHLQRGGLLHSGLLFVHRANVRKGLSARWRHNFFTSTKVTGLQGIIYPLIENTFPFTTYKPEKRKWTLIFKTFPLCSLIQKKRKMPKISTKSSKSFQTYCFLPLKGHNYSLNYPPCLCLQAI